LIAHTGIHIFPVTANGFGLSQVTNYSLEFPRDQGHNRGIQKFAGTSMRYTISTPLVAIRLCLSGDSDKAGVVTSLPTDVIVEVLGPSDLGRGMIEVAWERQRYAVFELDLQDRATLEPVQELVGN
jgi:hypothetical protein